MLTIIPADTEVIEAARLADAAHLPRITDGCRTCLSPVGPQGWTRLGVHVRTAEQVAA